MQKHVSRTLVALLALALCGTAVFAQSKGKMDKKEPLLYTRLGGEKAITAVVDEFVSRVAADNGSGRLTGAIRKGVS